MRSPEEIIRELEQEIRRRDKREEGKTLIGTCGGESPCDSWHVNSHNLENAIPFLSPLKHCPWCGGKLPTKPKQ